MKKIIQKKILLITILLPSFCLSDKAISADVIAAKSAPTVNTLTANKSWRISLGLGASIKNNLRRNNNKSGSGGDVVFTPLPLLQIAWGPISVGQQGVNAAFYGNQQTGASLNFNQAGDRYYGTGMEIKKESWLLGLGLKYHKFSFLFAKDISARSRGAKLNFNYAELYPLGKNMKTRSSLGLECYDQKFAQYYFGVKANEVMATRREYNPKKFCQLTMSFFPIYSFDEHLDFMAGLSFKGVSKEVKNSPLIKSNWLESALIIGSLWKF